MIPSNAASLFPFARSLVFSLAIISIHFSCPADVFGRGRQEAALESSASNSGGERPDEKPEEKNADKHKSKVRGSAPCVSWVKFGVPVRALLICVHGLGLNSSCFESLGKDLSNLGIATYAIDVRGFGSWMEARGRTKVDFKECIADLRKAIEWARKSEPGKPVFLLGESMGGAIVLHAASQYPQLVNGVVSACAAADRFNQKKTELSVFLKALTGPLRDVDIKKSVIEPASGENEYLKAQWEGDPLARQKISPIELMQFQRFMNENHEVVAKIESLPVLIVQGVNDKLVKPEGTKELFDELKTADKELLEVDGEHLIFENQQYSTNTLQALVDWIFARCPKASGASGVGPKEIARLLEKTRQALASGQLRRAEAGAKEALAAAPLDPAAHLLAGQVFMQSKQFMQARQELVQAIKLAKGSPLAAQANRLLMTMPKPMLGARLNSAAAKRRLSAGANPAAKAKVIVFNASWCKPCQDMTAIVEQARAKVGDLVEFSILDVDDPANEKLVEDYSVGPVPTTVFLTADGRIAGSQVGYGGVDGMLSGMQDLLQASAPAARPGAAMRMRQRGGRPGAGPKRRTLPSG